MYTENNLSLHGFILFILLKQSENEKPVWHFVSYWKVYFANSAVNIQLLLKIITACTSCYIRRWPKYQIISLAVFVVFLMRLLIIERLPVLQQVFAKTYWWYEITVCVLLIYFTEISDFRFLFPRVSSQCFVQSVAVMLVRRLFLVEQSVMFHYLHFNGSFPGQAWLLVFSQLSSSTSPGREPSRISGVYFYGPDILPVTPTNSVETRKEMQKHWLQPVASLVSSFLHPPLYSGKVIGLLMPF